MRSFDVQYPYPSSVVSPSKALIAATLHEDVVSVLPSQIELQSLTEDYRFLYLIVCSVLHRVSHTSIFSVLHGRFVHAIGIGLPTDATTLIYRYILATIAHRLSTDAISFGVVATCSRFKSHLCQGKQTVPPDVDNFFMDDIEGIPLVSPRPPQPHVVSSSLGAVG
ncbi:hypothetical protein F0562_010447 [Nyssa sinensis]|uniref:Uncharacterized protein n=1 Tax=Nyssa sinensis TaxID=561372 RepID=A0A5J5A2X7_9ASTE|nr:hypothetical protein F0562_010447 [Nyssa sinensis]